MRRQHKQGKYVFCDPATGVCFTRTANRIKYFMRDLCLRAGIQHFGAHSLRHFVATNINDPYRAQKVLGHQNLRTTEIYLHDLEVDRGAAEVFENITQQLTHENGSGDPAQPMSEKISENVKVRRRKSSTHEITHEITHGITHDKSSTHEKGATKTS